MVTSLKFSLYEERAYWENFGNGEGAFGHDYSRVLIMLSQAAVIFESFDNSNLSWIPMNHL